MYCMPTSTCGYNCQGCDVCCDRIIEDNSSLVSYSNDDSYSQARLFEALDLVEKLTSQLQRKIKHIERKNMRKSTKNQSCQISDHEGLPTSFDFTSKIYKGIIFLKRVLPTPQKHHK